MNVIYHNSRGLSSYILAYILPGFVYPHFSLFSFTSLVALEAFFGLSTLEVFSMELDKNGMCPYFMMVPESIANDI